MYSLKEKITHNFTWIKYIC